MKSYLLDTHTFLWWIVDDPRLSPKTKRIIASDESKIYFSVVSAWEIAIKANLGRLKKAGEPEITIPEQLQQNRFLPLGIGLGAALKVYSLPKHHEDPFDRLLVAQAIVEELPILSRDEMLGEYPVKVIW